LYKYTHIAEVLFVGLEYHVGM